MNNIHYIFISLFCINSMHANGINEESHNELDQPLVNASNINDSELSIVGAIIRGTIQTSNNQAQYDKLIKESKLPVIVKFYAPWCPSCKAIDKHFTTISKQFAGKAIFINVNTDKHKGLLSRYKIRKIPTFLFIKNGKVTTRALGPSAQKLKQLTTSFLNTSAT
jgi:thioredoxin